MARGIAREKFKILEVFLLSDGGRLKLSQFKTIIPVKYSCKI